MCILYCTGNASKHEEGHNALVLFIIGKPVNDVTHRLILREAEDHNDIIYVDYQVRAPGVAFPYCSLFVNSTILTVD